MGPMLAVFLGTCQEALKTFGEAAPQSGEPYYRSSAALHELESQMEATLPGADWDSPAAQAYAKAAAEQRLRVGKMSDLDARMGAQIDRSANVTAGGRDSIASIRDRVIGEVGNIPEEGNGFYAVLVATSNGMEEVGGVLTWAHSESTSIAAGVRAITAEYEALADLKLSPGEELPGWPGQEEDDDRPISLDDIMKNYQVDEDPGGLVKLPRPLSDMFGDKQFTASEARLLMLLKPGGLWDMHRFEEQAREEAKKRFPSEFGDEWDNQTDAFRHAYWNALMTKRFGKEWTAAYATAHERLPSNYPASEAMDLYNNEVGRNIAAAHPDASPEELADLVQQAVNNGETVVVRPDGQGVAWSDQLTPAETGDSSRSAPVGTNTPKPVPGYNPFPI